MTRDEMLDAVTKVRTIVTVVEDAAEVAFPAEALEIKGLALGLDKVFDLVVKLTANRETFEEMAARLRTDTLDAVKAIPSTP